jgi:DNA-nicking Smr family endonuclease
MNTTEHKRKRPRRLTDEEKHVWGRVARSVTPISRTIPADDLATKEHTSSSNSGDAPAQSPLPRAKSQVSAPTLASFDRRTRQKLARGRNVINGRIDLHGMTQAQAHTALRRFLQQAQAEGARFVLVVTGKGRDPNHGVLRRQVPLWLALPEFRSLVVGFDQAHIGHGGEGALYVRMRRG